MNFLEQRNDIISNLQPKALLNTFKESITTELSFESERRSIERFANNFEARFTYFSPTNLFKFIKQ